MSEINRTVKTNSIMKIKVCGMRNPENIKMVSDLKHDYMGFIFYPPSKRYVGSEFPVSTIDQVDSTIKKIGVFVNEDLDTISKLHKKYKLDYVQVHGDETAEYCSKLSKKGVRIIKAFRIDNTFDFEQTKAFKPYCDFFLFDTKGALYGGNGTRFNWEILKNYDNETPFFLSGGIAYVDIPAIQQMKHLNIESIDINSKFEIEPGLKDEIRLTELIKLIVNE